MRASGPAWFVMRSKPFPLLRGRLVNFLGDRYWLMLALASGLSAGGGKRSRLVSFLHDRYGLMLALATGLPGGSVVRSLVFRRAGLGCHRVRDAVPIHIPNGHIRRFRVGAGGAWFCDLLRPIVHTRLIALDLRRRSGRLGFLFVGLRLCSGE